MSDFLVYAYQLDGKGSATALSKDEVLNWRPGKGILWLHLDYSHPEARAWLEATQNLDDIALSALTSEEARPRAAAHSGGLLMALRGVNLNPNADPEDMVSIRLFVEQNRIISSRKRRLLSVDDIVAQLKAGEGPESSGDFVATLCDRLVRRISGPVDDAEDRLDSLEESLLTIERSKLRNELGSLRRQCITLRRYLAPQREALGWIFSERVSWFGDAERLRVRESGDRLSQYIEALDSIRERAAVTQEELINQISEESNNRMYILSIVSAVFLPLGFATGLLGVNVGGIPGADDDNAFLVFIGIMVLIAGGMLAYFRYKKWV